VKYTFFIFILLCQIAAAQTVSEDRPELESQRREFESRLYTKVDTAVGTIADKGAYIVNVSVALKQIPAEVVSPENVEADRFPLSTSKSFDGSAGMVPLSKIGIWQSHAVTAAKAKAIVHKIRRFVDLIQTVSVDIYLDPDRVSAAQKISVQKVIEAIMASSSPVQPRLNISDLKISYPKKVDENLKGELLSEIKKQLETEKVLAGKEPKAEKPNWISEFKIPLSIVFTTFALFVLGLIMNRRQALHDERRLKLDEEISKRQEEQLRSSIANDSSAPMNVSDAVAVAPTWDETELAKVGSGGFAQFKEIAAREPARAGLLIKQWIYSSDLRAQGALAILPRAVDMDHLRISLQLLSDADRKEWSRLIHKPLAAARLSECDAFVSLTIASNLVEPVQEIDDHARQQLAAITPQEAADCIKDDKSVGVLLIQTLPSLQISRIFGLLDVHSIRDVARASALFDKTQLPALIQKFEICLAKVRRIAKNHSSAFVDRVPELIREIGFAKEPALFDSVAQTQNVKLLQQIAVEYFPAELVTDLPTDILKSVFDRMPQARGLTVGRAQLAIICRFNSSENQW
jgi:hypothetical protein